MFVCVQEEVVSEQLQAFGFVAPSHQAVPIATALLGSAARGGRRLRAVAALGVGPIQSDFNPI